MAEAEGRAAAPVGGVKARPRSGGTTSPRPVSGRGFLFGRRDVAVAATTKGRKLVPVVRERLADLETPVSAFAKLRPLGGAFLLESVEGGERMGRYSFIGVLPRATLVFRDGTATIVEDGGARTIDYADPLDLLRGQ